MPWREGPNGQWIYAPASTGPASVEYSGYTDHPGPRPNLDADQEDLTGDDYLAVTTAKVFDADDELPSPPQDPRWRPVSVIDEHGEAVQ